MNIESFKELLAGYLTDPEYAKVAKLADGRLKVALPDGEQFLIKVSKLPRR